MTRYMQLHAGPLTAHKGYELIAFDFRVNGTDDPDGIVQGSCGRVETITEASGVFTVQLAQPWPRQLINPHAWLATAHASTIEDAKYDLDSYDATTGIFTISCVTDDGDGTYTVEAVTDNGVVSFSAYGQTMDQMVEDDAAP